MRLALIEETSLIVGFIRSLHPLISSIPIPSPPLSPQTSPTMAGSTHETADQGIAPSPSTSVHNAPAEKTLTPSETELSEKSASTPAVIEPEQGEAGMTRAKWLACIALGLGKLDVSRHEKLQD